MINCEYLGYNEVISFGTIIEEKYNPAKTILRAISGRVNTCYTQYLTNFPTLERKKRSALKIAEVNERDALQLCYSSPTDSFKFIRGKIFEKQPIQLKAFCPYCLLNKPRTLDHYIGQTEFPEYSILIKNLIPCCYDCNQKKDDKWRKNRQRRFIHFYSDSFLGNKFLHAKLIYPRGHTVPSIHYYNSKPSVMSIADYRIVKTHFKDLDLLNEYNVRANALVSSEIEVMKNSVASGVAKTSIVNDLMNRSASQAGDFGVNYWSAVMYETLATNRRLIKSL